MTAYEIRLSGCDDHTDFVMDLDDTEAALLQKVAALSRETSAFSCQPQMTVTTPPTAED